MGEDRLYEFVDANWKPSSVQEEDEEWYEPDIYEQIESCTEEKIGWMYIASIMIDTAFHDNDKMAWELFYAPPPHIVLW